MNNERRNVPILHETAWKIKHVKNKQTHSFLFDLMGESTQLKAQLHSIRSKEFFSNESAG